MTIIAVPSKYGRWMGLIFAVSCAIGIVVAIWGG
jgi:hypothetical protein